LKGGIELLAEYQARLAAQDTYGVLVVLQALDAAGKDGTIRHVLSGVNPQGVRVESFKVPSARELDQDFLRRYQQRLPSRGEIGIFNRSHYEEVLVVRVHPENLLREKLPVETCEHHVWARRCDAINDWDPQYPRLSDVALRDLETAKRRLEAEAPNGAAADPFEPRESGGNRSNGDTAVPITPSGTPAQREG
jgi:hypothetical protein